MAQNLIVEDKEAHLSCYTSTKNRNAKQGNTKGLVDTNKQKTQIDINKHNARLKREKTHTRPNRAV